MRMRKARTFGRMLGTSIVSVAMLAALQGLGATATASAGASRSNTAPSLSRQAPGRIGGPQSIDRIRKPNRNVSKKSGYQGETTVAIDPLDANHILTSANDLTGNNAAQVYESTDGGKTWANANVGLTTLCYDPWLDFNAAGDAFFSYECSNESYAYRLHGTSTWVKTTFSSQLVGSFPDRDMIQVDTGPSSPFKNSVYIGYDDNGNANTAYVLFSRDGKTNWTRSNAFGTNTIGVNVAVTPDGTVYATYLHYQTSQLMMAKSTNGGATFGAPVVVTTLLQNTSSFFVSIPPQQSRGIVFMPFTEASTPGNPNPNRVYISYEDRASSGTPELNIYVITTDNGTTFSSRVKVNDDTGSAYQFFPSIAVTPDGRVGVSWYDTRRDGVNHKTDVFFAASTNGGTSFGTNRRITTAQSDETIGGSNANQYGDYEGLDAGPTNHFGAVWCDSRPGNLNEELYYAKVV
jgi:hypothetical protein